MGGEIIVIIKFSETIFVGCHSLESIGIKRPTSGAPEVLILHIIDHCCLQTCGSIQSWAFKEIISQYILLFPGCLG